jgi:hypothetical protein
MSDDFWDGPDWQDWMIIGPMSEEIAEERIEKDPFTDMDDEDNDTDSDFDPEAEW